MYLSALWRGSMPSYNFNSMSERNYDIEDKLVELSRENEELIAIISKSIDTAKKNKNPKT